MVEYHPISAKDQSRLHQFCSKVLPGVFPGYAFCAVGIWTGDTYGCRHCRIGRDGRIGTPRQKAQCKRSVNAAKKWKLHFSSRRWNSQNLQGRTAPDNIHLTWERRERGEEQEMRQGKSDELDSPTHLQEDSTRNDEVAESDFWSITGDFIYRHHVEPRVKLYVLKEETLLIPMKYIDVTRTTQTSLDVLLEKNIDDYWNVDGERELSDAWTGFTRFILLNERPANGFTWSCERLTRKETLFRFSDPKEAIRSFLEEHQDYMVAEATSVVRKQKCRADFLDRFCS